MSGNALLSRWRGCADVSTRWIVTHDFAEWKEEIAWMSLYFSLAVWSSLALLFFYSLEDHCRAIDPGRCQPDRRRAGNCRQAQPVVAFQGD